GVPLPRGLGAGQSPGRPPRRASRQFDTVIDLAAVECPPGRGTQDGGAPTGTRRARPTRAPFRPTRDAARRLVDAFVRQGGDDSHRELAVIMIWRIKRPQDRRSEIVELRVDARPPHQFILHWSYSLLDGRDRVVFLHRPGM